MILALSLIAPRATAQTSAADYATARDLFNAGRELRTKGELRAALEKFKAAHALGQTPITAIELGRTHMMLGELVEAQVVFLSIARIPVAGDETERSAKARAEGPELAGQIAPRIPGIIVRLVDVPMGAAYSVTLDGGPFPPSLLGQRRLVNPGPHNLSAKIEPNGPEVRESIDLPEGQTREVRLVFPRALPPPPPRPTATTTATTTAPPPPPPPPPPKRNRLATTGFAIGGTGLAIGFITGLIALQKKDSLERSPDCVGKVCGPEAHDDIDTARSMATIATVSFVIGALGLGLGIYGVVSARPQTNSARVTPFIGLGSAGLAGSF